MTAESARVQKDAPDDGAHWLKRELDHRLQNDPSILEFLENGALDGLWYWDLEGMHEEWLSPRFKALFGYADHEMDNTVAWWQSHIHPDDLAVALDNFEKHKADPSHRFDQIVRYRHRDGHTVWVRCRGLMIRDGQGRPLRMLGAHTDVTALKTTEQALEQQTQDLQARIVELQFKEQQLEEQAEELVSLAETLEEARADLADLNAQKDKFFSIVAHDLKSPFTPLLGFSELLATQGGSLAPETVAEYGGLLHRAATEAYKLLEDLLDWSRIQLDRVEYDPGAVDLAELVARNRMRYQYALQDKDLTLNTDGVQSCHAWADPRMLDTVVRNLLSNAIKFTHKGGDIRFETESFASTVCLRIRDSGVGIAPEKIPGLFGLGARASVAGTKGEVGTGMGLVISKELMDRQDGKITVESTLGAGSTFTLTLPVA